MTRKSVQLFACDTVRCVISTCTRQACKRSYTQQLQALLSQACETGAWVVCARGERSRGQRC
ncbi:hypothetical protein B0H10DRAFT_2013320 [Mycena sp. CBHHK59/15]|nr:hypothetical protein B0H10DRAFT_2013320 [Mycena sp. CBHHK59/15]